MSIRIVQIGYGYWGRQVARNLQSLGALYGICEPDPQRRQQSALDYPAARPFEALAEVLRDPAVDAVAICTPAATHAEIALQAVQAGKDVFVEKPLALGVADGQRLVEAAGQHGGMLMVGHLLEYHPAVVKLDELVQAGELGHVQYVYSNRLHLGRFRQEENILWSFAPHDVAVIVRLMQREPVQVSATGGAYLQPRIADVTVTNLLFDDGARAHIFVSWLHPYKEHRLVVVGSKKMAVFNDLAAPGLKLTLYDKGVDWTGDTPVPGTGDGIPVPYDEAEPLREELAHFVHCVRSRQTPLTDGRNGLRVLRILEAAQQSLQAGGACIDLPPAG